MGIINCSEGYKCRFDGEKTQRYIKKYNPCYTNNAKKLSKEYIITFPDGHEENITNLEKFSRENNLDCPALRHVCSGRMSHTKGFKCRYSTDIKQRYIPKSMPKWTEKRRKVMEDKYREYIIIYPNGREIQINSLNKFCKENDINKGNMHLVLEGKQESHKGFKCKYVEPENFIFKKWDLKRKTKNKYKLIGPDGTEYITNELSRFCEEHSLHCGIMHDVMSGRQKQHRGFKAERIN